MIDAEKLKYLRNGARMTQTEFGEALGLSLRAVQDLEGGKAAVRQIHLNAAAWALMKLAEQSGKGIDFLPVEIGDVVRSLCAQDRRARRGAAGSASAN